MDENRRKNAQKVVVAMSGGVDSSVAAALLKRASFNVIGVFMKFWVAPHQNFGGGWNRCCSPEAERRARQVSAKLDIPFYVFNFEKEFKKRIVDRFLEEYKAGRTPNPCVVCNKEIKFGLLLEKALTLDADFVATGHYTRLREDEEEIHLFQGKDKEKDQSYFLWQLSQNQLKHILFPVGNYTKDRIRLLAKKFKLPVFDIPESMEICFIEDSVNDFLVQYLKPKPGPIVEQAHYGVKKIVGQHQGLWFYTIGQRKGIKLPGGPYWVLDKDVKRNLLIVTKNEKDLFRKELVCEKVNWISGKTPKLPLKIKAKVRYRHKDSWATCHKLKTTPKRNQRFLTGQEAYKLIFDRPQKAITPGQSVVFYKGQELLGGGVIC